MKRRDLIKKISKATKTAQLTWDIHREGANHTVYRLDGLMIPIPRHPDIDEQLAQLIFKECEPKLGKRWWK